MVTFQYRSFVEVDGLAVNECTIHRASDPSDASNARWWNLWVRVRRNDGVEDVFVIAVAPRGQYQDIPGRRTWGLMEIANGSWQVAPSINVLVSLRVVPGHEPQEVSLWHENVVMEGVPVAEVWAQGGIP